MDQTHPDQHSRTTNMPHGLVSRMAHPWRPIQAHGWSGMAAGRFSTETIGMLLSRWESHSSLKEHLVSVLSCLNSQFAFVLEDSTHIIAAVDGIRSYPLYYVNLEGQFSISDDPRHLQNLYALTTIDPIALLELQTIVYVTGSNTLLKDLHQLQASEILIWEKDHSRLEKARHYVFYSQDKLAASASDLVSELARRTDDIFRRAVKHVEGHDVWVPLSGGLDSRLVLSKLKEHGCQRLKSFSWGPPGNREARAAEKVAARIGVPWVFVSDTRRTAREFFYSEARSEYWRYADGLHVVPNLNQQVALRRLIKDGGMNPGDFVINGQSGDFVAGDHIPDIPSGSHDFVTLLDRIILKHCSHRPDLLTNENIELLKSRIAQNISKHATSPVTDEQEFADQYELWEWQERQAKRVINGQRNYDFLGLNWLLPLWDREYLNFWPTIPVDLKKHRRLFIDYVMKYDFFDVFNDFSPSLSRWPGRLIAIQYLGHLVKLVLGATASKNYYQMLDYFSQYSPLYSHLTYKEYLRLQRNHKGPLSIYATHWLKENLYSSSTYDVCT